MLALIEFNRKGKAPFLQCYHAGWWSALVPSLACAPVTKDRGGEWALQIIGSTWLLPDPRSNKMPQLHHLSVTSLDITGKEKSQLCLIIFKGIMHSLDARLHRRHRLQPKSAFIRCRCNAVSILSLTADRRLLHCRSGFQAKILLLYAGVVSSGRASQRERKQFIICHNIFSKLISANPLEFY